MREISDHVAIKFDLRHGHILANKFTHAKWNWKKADKKAFTDSFKATILSLQEIFHQLETTPRPNTQLLEEALDAIHQSLEEAAEATMPIARPCNCSVPWWNDQLSTLKDARVSAKCALTASKRFFGYPLPALSATFQQRDNLFQSTVKWTKKRYFHNILEEATEKEIYNFHNWSKAHCVSHWTDG
jgi:hypothetical protein